MMKKFFKRLAIKSAISGCHRQNALITESRLFDNREAKELIDINMKRIIELEKLLIEL